MKIITDKMIVNTKGNPDLLDITVGLSEILKASKLKTGNLTVFAVGSTLAVTTIEYEPGLIKDIAELYEKIIPQGKHYHHDDTWGDANGYSHLRSTLTGTSLVIPFKDGKFLLGRWQQVVLAEFDNRPRQRTIIAQLMGE